MSAPDLLALRVVRANPDAVKNGRVDNRRTQFVDWRAICEKAMRAKLKKERK